MPPPAEPMVYRKLDNDALRYADELQLISSLARSTSRPGEAGSRPYRSHEKQGIVGLDIPHDIPAGEDARSDEKHHQQQEGVVGDGNISGVIVVGDGEQWREGSGHGRGGAREPRRAGRYIRM